MQLRLRRLIGGVCVVGPQVISSALRKLLSHGRCQYQVSGPNQLWEATRWTRKPEGQEVCMSNWIGTASTQVDQSKRRWIFGPCNSCSHCKTIIQTWHPGRWFTDIGVEDRLLDSVNKKLGLALKMSQRPMPKYWAFSFKGKVIVLIWHTSRAARRLCKRVLPDKSPSPFPQERTKNKWNMI